MVSYSPGTILMAEHLKEACIVALFSGQPNCPANVFKLYLNSLYINVVKVLPFAHILYRGEKGTPFTNITNCPDCGSKLTYFGSKHYELLCNSCGLVLEDNLTYPEEPKEINLFEKSTDIPIKYPNSARTNKERALKSALDELNLISIEINLPESKRNYILNTYSILYEKGYTNGRSRKLILLSIIRGKSL